MIYNIRFVSSYPPKRCGIGTFTRDLANALQNYSEVGSINVAAIGGKKSEKYDIPVDIVISPYDSNAKKSWSIAKTSIIDRAEQKSDPTIIVLQHEYGLDPNPNILNGGDKGNNYVDMAKFFRNHNMVVVAYLHTVRESPTPHQKKVIAQLGKYCDGLVVTTEGAVGTLKKVYGVSESKVQHIDHGIRMSHVSQSDRITLKKKLGLEGKFLVTTIGMKSPDKGLQFSVPAYAYFLRESLTPRQQRDMVYLIGGAYHPEFVVSDDGIPFEAHKKLMESVLNRSKKRAKGNFSWQTIENLGEGDFSNNDIIFLDNFMDESTLLDLYGATDAMILPYLQLEQISSGILADTLGSGRIAVATKFRYANEMLGSRSKYSKGMKITNKGVLVDPGEESVSQIAQGLDFLVFNETRRHEMENNAHRRGNQMRWNTSAFNFIEYVRFILDARDRVSRSGRSFVRRKKGSRFEEKNIKLLQSL